MDINAYAAVFHAPITPCFHCLYDKTLVQEIHELKALDHRCEKKPLSVAAPSLFLSTGFAVNEALKILLSVGRPAYNRYFLFNQRGSEEIAEAEGHQQIVFPFSAHFKKICKEQGFDWERGWRGRFLEELSIEKDDQCPLCGPAGPFAGRLDGESREAPLADPGAPSAKEGGDAADPAASTLSDLREFLSGKMPDYMIPASFTPMNRIPLKPNGKVDWQRLPEPEAAVDQPRVPPEGGLERRLARIWSRALGVAEDRVGRESNFFEMGGHSLKATKVVSGIRKQLQIKVPLAEVFRSPTIGQLAAYIREEEPAAPEPDGNLVLLRKGSDPGTHLFMVHAGNGQVEAYLEFANLLDDRFNCWAFAADAPENFRPVKRTNESIAKKYVSQIKYICKESPCYIAGWCLGGPLTLEIVRQLEEGALGTGTQR